MTETKPNAKLAYKVLDLIKLNRERFDMGEWARGPEGGVTLKQLTDPNVCGTTACFAGWVIALSGYEVGTNGRVYDMRGPFVSGDVSAFAAGLLGLDSSNPDLFYGDDWDIAEVVQDWFGPRPGAES